MGSGVLSILASPAQTHHTGFLCGCWGLKSGPHACFTPTEPSPSPNNAFILLVNGSLFHR